MNKMDPYAPDVKMVFTIFILLFILGHCGNAGLLTILGVNTEPVWVIIKRAYSIDGIPLVIGWLILYDLATLIFTAIQIGPFFYIYSYLKSRE